VLNLQKQNTTDGQGNSAGKKLTQLRQTQKQRTADARFTPQQEADTSPA
jgi:hypothetical protein